MKGRCSHVENVLFVCFLCHYEVAIKKESVEVGSDLIAYLSEHSVV